MEDITDKDIKIKEVIDVYVTYGNTDLTEGRGSSFPLYVSDNPITAKRLGEGEYIQGSNCPTRKEFGLVVEIDKYKPIKFTLIPGVINSANKEDEIIIKKMNRKEAAKKKLVELGLSSEELKEILKDIESYKEGND